MEIAHRDLEKMLEEGYDIQVKPHGYSMYPMIIPERDAVIITKVGKNDFKRGDVVLYRREQGILVLHRVCKVNKKGVYLVGDNQSNVEGPLRKEQIKGKMTKLIRNGKEIEADNVMYKFLTGTWLVLLPVREPIKTVAYYMKKLVLKLKH